MRMQILAGAALFALAAGATMTTSATASDDKAGRSGSHAGPVHVGGMHSLGVRHGRRYARVRGFQSARHGGWEGDNPNGHAGFISLGPLGFTAGCGQRCGQGYSVSARSW